MTPKELETHLRPIDYFVTHSKRENYETILAVLASTRVPCGVGYHRDYGWFVLRSYEPEEDGPELLWSQRRPE